jgi:hypothetical protein
MNKYLIEHACFQALFESITNNAKIFRKFFYSFFHIFIKKVNFLHIYRINNRAEYIFYASLIKVCVVHKRWEYSIRNFIVVSSLFVEDENLRAHSLTFLFILKIYDEMFFFFVLYRTLQFFSPHFSKTRAREMQKEENFKNKFNSWERIVKLSEWILLELIFNPHGAFCGCIK